MKICASCRKTKSLDQFGNYANRKDGKHYYCKPCAAQKAKEFVANNPEKSRVWKHRSRLRAQYGITPEDYDVMYKEQDGRCAICSVGREVLDIDHCHTTKKVRGLLCPQCNKALGLMRDDAGLLRKAAEYLV